MSKISIIVAASNNLVIGKGAYLPFLLPTDLKNFKRVTKGFPVIMGRKCWESLPPRFRPLPERLNIIVTRNKDFVVDHESVKTSHDLEELLWFYKLSPIEEEVFIIGGSDIYEMAFKFADKLYLTHVHQSVEGDVFLKGLDTSKWEVNSISDLVEENGFSFKFWELEKIKA